VELRSVRLAESPSAKDRVRLVGEVAYDDCPGTEEYWFEFPESLARHLTPTADPWIACLLPLAATLGQPLRLCVPPDPVLAANVPRILEIWTRWYRERFPNLRAVPLESPPPQKVPLAPEPRLGAGLFSGGVDSFFMALRDSQRPRQTASRRSTASSASTGSTSRSPTARSTTACARGWRPRPRRWASSSSRAPRTSESFDSARRSGAISPTAALC
jgi:hypothetical protein